MPAVVQTMEKQVKGGAVTNWLLWVGTSWLAHRATPQTRTSELTGGGGFGGRCFPIYSFAPLGLSIIFAYYRWAMPTAMILRPFGAGL